MDWSESLSPSWWGECQQLKCFWEVIPLGTLLQRAIISNSDNGTYYHSHARELQFFAWNMQHFAFLECGSVLNLFSLS